MSKYQVSPILPSMPCIIPHFNFCLTGVAGQCGNTDNTFLLDKLCGEIFGFVDENTIAAQLVCGKTMIVLFQISEKS